MIFLENRVNLEIFIIWESVCYRQQYFFLQKLFILHLILILIIIMTGHFTLMLIMLNFAQLNAQSKYRLYMEPQTIFGPFTTTEQSQPNVIIPENHDLIIVYTFPAQTFFAASICRYSNGQIQTQNDDRLFRFQAGFVNAFWVGDQFLLVVWNSLIILFRPHFYGWQQKTVELLYNGTIIRSTIVKREGKEYLIVIEDGNDSWIMKKYQLQADNQTFIKFFNQTKIKKLQSTIYNIQLIRTNNFICLMLRQNSKSYHIDCLNSDNNITAEFSVNTNFVAKQGDLKSDSIFFFETVFKYIVVFSISQDGTDIRQTFIYQSDRDEEYLVAVKIVRKEIILVLGLYKEPYNIYLKILQQNNQENYTITQYITFDKVFRSLIYAGKQNNELTLFSKESDNQRCYLVYTKYMNQQSGEAQLIIISSLLMILLICLACLSFLHFQVLIQFFLFEKMHLSLLAETAIIAIIHLGILIMTLQTNTSANANFQYNPQRSTSPQSFELRMYQTMFYFTALVSVLLESSTQFKAKNTYLGFLVKHGLKTNFYFYYRQMVLIIRGIVYGMASTTLFSFLESNCNPQLRLYPSMEQMARMATSYTLCLYTLYNIGYIFAYLCKRYWYFLQLFLSIIFFFSFVTNQFYINKVVILEQKTAVCLSPVTLFSTILQQIFKTEIRFNDRDVSSAFLLLILILQPLVAFGIFRVIFNLFFKVTRLELITGKSSRKQSLAINQSTQSEDLNQKMKESGQKPLLQVFIPCKLSTNEGFEKVNILRNIKFSGKRGDILTFLDYENTSKRTLFEILVNNQHSDKQIERDVEGRVSYSQQVKVSIVLDDSPFFGDLNVIERLQLISRLRENSLSRRQQENNIQFILNEFNIPQEFRVMKSCELSGGYLKKAALACAFIGNPDVVIIDQPTLGLDIRFRNIFHRKLREWKHNMLIIIGTSDQAEADAISDKIWVMQNGKAIDRSVENYRRLMTQLKMSFCKKQDYDTILKLVGTFFKDIKTLIQEECNQLKSSYKIGISLFDECLPSKQLLRHFMREVNSTLPLNGDQLFMNFSIVEHPYDESSLKPFKEEPLSQLKGLTYKDIQLYYMNKVFEEDSDDQATDKYESPQDNRQVSEITKLLTLLKKQEEKQSIMWAQMKGIIYLNITLWKGGRLSRQQLIASTYSWAYCIFLYKMKRSQEGYDFVNILITYCLLHLSLVDLRTNQGQLASQISPHIYITATWLYDFIYLFVGFSINTLLQGIILQAIILDRSEFKILEKLVCSVFFIGCYTIFTPNLIKVVRQRRHVIAILLLTHLCLIQANSNSFVIAYATSGVTVSEILQYFFYPLTVMALYNSLLSNQQSWVFVISMLLQIGLLFLMLNLLHIHTRRVNKQLSKNYRHVLSQAINEQRMIVQNTEYKKEVPVLCDNLVHLYVKEAVLSNLYLKVNMGEIYGLLGHNGCGKTTALKIIAGKLTPTHGNIILFGEEPINMRMKIGYCPQEGLLIEELTVQQNIRLAGALKGLREKYVSRYMMKLIVYFRLRALLQVRASYLSASQKKKISLIMALLGFPQLLLFDEVTGSVDPEGRRRILNLIKSYSSDLGGTVLMASHDIAEAEDICDRVSIFKDGILRKAGTPNSLRAESQHQFSILTLNFARGNHETVLKQQKAQIRGYVGDLIFVKLELEQTTTLAYSLDIRQINVLEVWETVYELFFLTGIIDKFCLRRHGLPEIIKQSIIGTHLSENRIQDDYMGSQNIFSEKHA